MSATSLSETSALTYVFLGLVLLFVTAAAYYMQLYLSQFWMLRHFRSAFSLPLIGNCFNPEVFSFFKFLSRLRKELGKTFVIYLFTNPYIVTVEPNIIRRVLADSKSFTQVSSDKELDSSLFGEGLLNSTGSNHSGTKAMLMKYLSLPKLAASATALSQLCAEAVDELISRDLTSTDSSTILNVDQFLSSISLRAFLRCTCGVDFRGDLQRETEICSLLATIGQTAGKVDRLPVFRLSSSSTKLAIDSTKTVRETLLALVCLRRNDGLFSPPTVVPEADLLGGMIANNMDDEEIVNCLFSLLAAAVHTTSVFSSFLLLLIAENVSVQDRLRQEVYMHLGIDGEATVDRIAGMKYMAAVVQEGLRLYTPVPYVTRRATGPVHIKGQGCDITIPAGADVLVPLYLVNRDPSVWQSPSKFDPSRFQGKTGFVSARSGFFPFGYGSRACPGNILAQLEIATLLSHLLRRLAFRPDPSFKVSLKAGMTLAPSNGVRVSVEKLSL
mmetsp:Transcript_24867/g.36680  ORF Transcript_24867/g.36680 Transcript_24867/m.36680 type:complete len:499 (-) Transcript_24867:328-1824(-)|eukprot:CAMPEP_0185025380 /NCGR_PEP_ID=MMETSP1103-20130426/8361_1 /TAXON_ID=36769 /ORGANISM="Paraphysomonas bandaiensis, Strain Caron Lab Isolate" /LENGTH=498 /DNA_ID=CAMNT_0027558571 /DNA_START=132 /DNA_END=1628 /DNA_ORIENTATION=-